MLFLRLPGYASGIVPAGSLLQVAARLGAAFDAAGADASAHQGECSTAARQLSSLRQTSEVASCVVDASGTGSIHASRHGNCRPATGDAALVGNSGATCIGRRGFAAIATSDAVQAEIFDRCLPSISGCFCTVFTSRSVDRSPDVCCHQGHCWSY